MSEKEKIEREVPEEYKKAMDDLGSKLQEALNCELRAEANVDDRDGMLVGQISVVDLPQGDTFREPLWPLLSVGHNYLDENPRSYDALVNLKEILKVKIHMAATRIPFTHARNVTQKISRIVKETLSAGNQPVHIQFLSQGAHLTRLRRDSGISTSKLKRIGDLLQPADVVGNSLFLTDINFLEVMREIRDYGPIAFGGQNWVREELVKAGLIEEVGRKRMIYPPFSLRHVVKSAELGDATLAICDSFERKRRKEIEDIETKIENERDGISLKDVLDRARRIESENKK